MVIHAANWTVDVGPSSSTGFTRTSTNHSTTSRPSVCSLETLAAVADATPAGHPLLETDATPATVESCVTCVHSVVPGVSVCWLVSPPAASLHGSVEVSGMQGVGNLSIKDADAEEKFQNAIERKVKKPKNYAADRRKGSAKGHLRTEDEWASLFGDGISGKLPQYEKLGGRSRFSVPPLDVQLDDISDSDVKDDINLTVDLDLSQTGEKPKRLKKKEKELRELEITSLNERHLKNDVPRSADEFEKLVRSSPNSSYLWIQYMAFMLSLSDIQKARSIAERALRTINIREENEKLNVWVAYLNLENEYGTPKEESVRNLFERALQYCDPKKIHVALLSLYDRTKQHTLANELLEKMSKKFRHSCKVWLQYVQNCLDQGKDDESQSIVKRALLSLPQRKHIKFISHAAILEFKFGDPVRGRTLFEKMLRDYPKRTDLWSIYIDQEIRLGDVEATRALFEKATCLSLPPKKIKFLLKKYLEFEKAQNDDEKIEYVKRKALEYVYTFLSADTAILMSVT